jgi:hypothetical protein
MKGKHIGILLMLIGLVGFVYFTAQKNETKIYEKKYRSEGSRTDSVFLSNNAEYIISFWAIDEEPAGFNEWPHMEARIKLFTKSEKLFTKKIVSTDTKDVGGMRRAQDYTDFSYHPKLSEMLYLKSELTAGDECEIIIYSELSESMNIKPGLFVIVLVTGIFVFLKYRAKLNKH